MDYDAFACGAVEADALEGDVFLAWGEEFDAFGEFDEEEGGYHADYDGDYAFDDLEQGGFPCKLTACNVER